MAWGYWSATTVSDRGRSPRRGQNVSTVSNIPVTMEDRPTVSTFSNVNSNNNTTMTPHNVVVPPVEFDIGPSFSRRPSLDLGHGPQGALAVVLCGAHGGRPQGGTLSAGNTLTRVGSRHTATSVEYAVPHHFHHHHATAAYVEYHHDHHQLSPSDDDDSEPGYATGIPASLNTTTTTAGLDLIPGSYGSLCVC